MLPSSLRQLIDELAELPGIGPRQAARIAFHILKLPADESKNLITAIIAAKKKTKICPVCFLGFEPLVQHQKTCAVCENKKRDKTAICVIERETDVEPIEKTGLYKGVYHIVGAQTDYLSKNVPVRIKRLLERIAFIKKQLPAEKQKSMEIILAMNATVEGDALASYLEKMIKPLNVKVSRLGRGLASGAELEYADQQTLTHALTNRK